MQNNPSLGANPRLIDAIKIVLLGAIVPPSFFKAGERSAGFAELRVPSLDVMSMKGDDIEFAAGIEARYGDPSQGLFLFSACKGNCTVATSSAGPEVIIHEIQLDDDGRGFQLSSW